jgi:hypothetical protein
LNQSECFKEGVVDVAVAPLFARLEGFDDCVLRLMKMLRGMFILRRVAAADVAADFTQAQVHPCVAHAQAVFAAFGAWANVSDLIQV